MIEPAYSVGEIVGYRQPIGWTRVRIIALNVNTTVVYEDNMPKDLVYDYQYSIIPVTDEDEDFGDIVTVPEVELIHIEYDEVEFE